MNDSLEGLLMPAVPPPPLPWWPPAPGWWILAGLVLLMLLGLPWVIRAIRRRQRRRRRAQTMLEQIADALPDRDWLIAVNTLLKRIAKHQGNEQATRLHGQAWIDYLCSSYPRPRRDALEPLADALYRSAPNLNADQRRALRREARRWIRHNHV